MLRHPCQLTALSHGGGCGCKIPSAVLSRLLSRIPAQASAALLVGGAGADDAAVYRLNDGRALVASPDFFAPVVDDPSDYGRIAAANALSDIYAMGAQPALALNLTGLPLERIGAEAAGAIVKGGVEVCAQAGVVVGGGHSIAAAEPFYGLAVLGFAPVEHIKTNAGARDGDALVLGKPLGIGVLAAALKKGRLGEAAYREMIRWCVKLNDIGAHLGALAPVHAMTDVTGFGLLGHLLEVCRASRVRAHLRLADIPLLEDAVALARDGIMPGALQRNWDGCRDAVCWDGKGDAARGGSRDAAHAGGSRAVRRDTVRDDGRAVRRDDTRDAARADAPGDIRRALLTDPQTSGGLLVACAPDAATEVVAEFHRRGFNRAACIGHLEKAAHAGIVIGD